MNYVDYAIIGILMALSMGVGIFFSRRKRMTDRLFKIDTFLRNIVFCRNFFAARLNLAARYRRKSTKNNLFKKVAKN